MRYIAAFLAALVLVAPVGANSGPDFGPPTGSKAPTIGTPLDQTGKPRSLQSLMGRNGLVLFFFRSAAWCPYCQLQLLDLNSGVAQIEQRGYRLAGISYEPPAVDAAFIQKRAIQYTLLSDPKSAIIDRYKLRDPQYPPGSRAYGVPRPIIFILDRHGVIKAKLFEDTFKKRPPVALVIETLDKVASSTAHDPQDR